MTDDNIFFLIDDDDTNANSNIDFNNINVYEKYLLNEIKYDCDDFNISKKLDYTLNCTVKELLLICDYYGLAKQLKLEKSNKEQIIEALVYFESDDKNELVVNRRKLMWFYINALKKDKIMKKYVIW